MQLQSPSGSYKAPSGSYKAPSGSYKAPSGSYKAPLRQQRTSSSPSLDEQPAIIQQVRFEGQLETAAEYCREERAVGPGGPDEEALSERRVPDGQDRRRGKKGGQGLRAPIASPLTSPYDYFVPLITWAP